ncbi:MAG: transglycosylase SLT domain-containing protein [Pseudobdellovibrionaceae bacterium]
MANKKMDELALMDAMIRREFPKYLKRKARAFKEKQKVLKNFAILSDQLLNEQKVSELKIENPPTHPWRPCPAGHCWVRSHPRQVKSTRKNPDGYTMVDGHCRINPKKKEIIFLDEIEKISESHFRDLKLRPCPIDLGFNKKTANGLAFDDLIAGWTQYWNDIFKPQEPLDPNLVKALIASESGFNAKSVIAVSKSKKNMARGLMQITDQTLKILNDEKGELKDHFVKLTKTQVMNPSANIYAGIRWLFHKKRLASGKLGHEASWMETIANYKSYLNKKIENPNEKFKGMDNITRNYGRLKECKK